MNIYDFLNYGHYYLRKLTDSEKIAIYDYTSELFFDINDSLRNIKFNLFDANIRDSILLIDSAIHKFDHSQIIKVYRGSSLSLNNYNKVLKELEHGICHEKAYMSTTINPKNAFYSTTKKNIYYELDVDSSIGAYVDSISAHYGEQEFLISRDRDIIVNDLLVENGIVKVKGIVK